MNATAITIVLVAIFQFHLSHFVTNLGFHPCDFLSTLGLL